MLAVLRRRCVLLEVRRLLQEASSFSSLTFIPFLALAGAVATLCAARNTLPAAGSALFLPFHVHSVLTLAVLRRRSVLLEVRRLLQEAPSFSTFTFILFDPCCLVLEMCAA